MKKAISLSILAALTMGAAHAVVILDDFMTGPYSVTLQATGSSAINWASAPTCCGGIRATYAQVVSNPRNTKLTVDIASDAPGFAMVSADTKLSAFFQLGYGFAANNQSMGTLPLNLNLSGASSIDLHMDSNDQDLAVRMYLLSNADGEGGGTSVVKDAIIPGGHPGDAFDFSIPTTGANLADVDSILFEFTTKPGGDFSLRSVDAVPEPSSAAAVALGFGFAGLIRRRARKQA